MDTRTIRTVAILVALVAIPVSIGLFVRGDGAVFPLSSGETAPGSDAGTRGIRPEDGGPDTSWKTDEQATFEALVVLRDQTGGDAGADLKRGDVLVVRKSPQEWSDTEWKSYLVVKLDLKGSEATALLDPKRDGDTVTLARGERIDLDRAGFSGGQVISGQPLLGNTFGKEIIIQK